MTVTPNAISTKLMNEALINFLQKETITCDEWLKIYTLASIALQNGGISTGVNNHELISLSSIIERVPPNVKIEIQRLALKTLRLFITVFGFDEEIQNVLKLKLNSLPEIPILFSSSHSCPSSSLVGKGERIVPLNEKIKTGQGEYVVFHQSSNDEITSPSQETFLKAYPILLSHSPLNLAKTDPNNAVQLCKDRYSSLKKEIKKIDPSLEVAFIPKILYELNFLRQAIEEEIKYNGCCFTRLNSTEKEKDMESPDKENVPNLNPNCWHRCFFTDHGDSNHPRVKDLVYKMNEVLVNTLHPHDDGFSFQELKSATENQISFLKGRLNQKARYPSISFLFGSVGRRAQWVGVGIRNDQDAQSIYKALSLECSELAEQSVLIYRGSNFSEDSVEGDGKDTTYSLSFGSGVFAGAFHDPGAMFFGNIRNGTNDAYAIAIHVQEVTDSIFSIPMVHTVAQLFGFGEAFHVRTRKWKNCKSVIGIHTEGELETYKKVNIDSELSREKFIEIWTRHQREAISLNS